MHKDVLCAESDFFTRCLNSGMREAENKEVELLEDRPEAFGFILNFLYDTAFRSRIVPAHAATFDNLIHAWMLADRLLMENGQNAVMDVIQGTIMKASDDKKLVRQGLRVLQMLEIKPGRNSSLHRFLVDRFAWDMKNTKTHLTGQPVPKLISDAELFFEGGGGIVVDVFNAFTLCMDNSSASSDPVFGRGCTYHEHKNGSEKSCWRQSTTLVMQKPTSKGGGAACKTPSQEFSSIGGGLFGTASNTTNSTSHAFCFGVPSSNASGGHFGSRR